MDSNSISDCTNKILNAETTNNLSSNTNAFVQGHLNEDIEGTDFQTVIDDPKIISIVFKHGKLGSSYYNMKTKLLYVYEEVLDWTPFPNCQSLLREVNPKYILIIGSSEDGLIESIKDFTSSFLLNENPNECNSKDNIATNQSEENNLPPNIYLLPLKEYSYESCKLIMAQQNFISGDNIEFTDTTKELYMHSLINFDHKLSMHSLGALIKYVQTHWTYLQTTNDDLEFVGLEQISIKDHVLIDTASFEALQIFEQKLHEANFKRGLQSNLYDGHSIFRLFASNCKSKIGQLCLKHYLSTPTNNVDILNKRLDFISFAAQPDNIEFVETMQENIRRLSNVDGILLKIKHARANCRDWYVLHKTTYYIVLMHELNSKYASKSVVLNELVNSITKELFSLECSIYNAIDMTTQASSFHPSIKLGVDEELDAKKLRLQDLSQHATAAAKVAMEKLPPFVEECSIIYLPEVGHLVSVKEWASNCNPEILQEYGFQYSFTLRGTFNYKHAICLELDQLLGGIKANIWKHENRIIQRLSSFVIKFERHIKTPLKILASIDCLLAMAKTALQNNYNRPHLNDENVFEIEECRHPLLELSYNFESNCFYSGGKHSHVKIITGPNGSGKSVFLKQVALIVYLAHIGSYVPAKSAQIAIVHSIHSRFQATESASFRLSSFMIDITQVGFALHHAKQNSLILLDEFSKGTINNDGLAVLLSFMDKFISYEKKCPHILLSTHSTHLASYLPNTSLIECLKMSHTMESNSLTFLYKTVPGNSASYAFEIATELGLDASVISRAKEIHNSLRNGQQIEPLTHSGNKSANFHQIFCEEMVEFLKHVQKES